MDKEKYEIIREGEEVIIRIDYEKEVLPPSVEDSAITMSRVIDILKKVDNATKIVFYQKRNYEYDFHQTSLLTELARLHNKIIREDVINLKYLQSGGGEKFANTWYTQVQNLFFNYLKSDPLGAYVELKRLNREEKINYTKVIDARDKSCYQKYLGLLNYLITSLEKTKLITTAKPYLVGFKLGDRTVYERLFTPTIKPDFLFTRLMAQFPEDAEELDSYTVGESGEIEVTIFDVPGEIQTLYHVMPPEFGLNEDKYELLDLARKVMAEHKPKRSEFVDPQRMREVFSHIGKDLLEELSMHKGKRLKEKEAEMLTKILVRYTVGFGLIEVLLQDEKIQDISINSPAGQIPMFIVHQDFDDCKTNILPAKNETESWASKLRMISGRPLDEANPILDTELELPGASTRVSTITYPLDPSGLAFSFRRHRDKPWTLPLFIKVRMITPLAAGLISFLVDGTRTMLICGTRSSGKSSFLSAILIEIMRRSRILTIEDTLELPTKAMKELGFNIQSMKVASALSTSSSEMSASDGIRSTLRLGDSALIVGEVRSSEAKALYEAMRVGAAANVVAGTIHGDSPYGIFDRVVNDIGVPKTSFKATDICIIANPVKSADGLHKYRRVTQITEVRKDWNDDPMTEGGFSDLMKYNAKTDALEASTDLMNGESEILKMIAAGIKEYAGNWDAVWDNITLRADIKDALVKFSEKVDDPQLLEAEFSIMANDQFHKLIKKIREEIGAVDNKRIFNDWNAWLKREYKKRTAK